MIDSILKILELWLGENSKTLHFILWIVDSIWAQNLRIIEVAVAITVWGIFILWVTAFKYHRVKWTGAYRHIKTYRSYIEEKWVGICFTLLFGTTFIFLVITQWLLINEFWAFLLWFGWDGKYNSWLAFLYWYDKESTMYWYYNLFRWVALIIIFIYTLYNGLMYYTRWEVLTGDGVSSKFYTNMKRGVVTLIIMIITAFSVFPDIFVSYMMDKVWISTSTTFDTEIN